MPNTAHIEHKEYIWMRTGHGNKHKHLQTCTDSLQSNQFLQSMNLFYFIVINIKFRQSRQIGYPVQLDDQVLP